MRMPTRWNKVGVMLALACALPLASSSLAVAKKREPPPAVIPTEETLEAQKQFTAGNFVGAVAQAKAALNKNERYTPAMLVMAKSYYKLRKFEWTRTLWDMMKANNASDAEQSEMLQILAFLELDRQNVPGAIELLKQAGDKRPDSAVIWNNLGAQYLEVKNYPAALPILEKAVQLQPTFAKAHLNLGSAYRGTKQYEKALESYNHALQLFPNYADAVFNLAILYLDADKMPNMDIFAQMNTCLGYFEKYKTMMGGTLPPGDMATAYIEEANGKILKEQKRIERIKKQEEREKARAAKAAAKAMDDAAKKQAADAAAAAAPAAPATPAPAAPATPTPAEPAK